jgi:hypothetical protein
MCYPKPGPRCSAYAAEKVAVARRNVFILLPNLKDDYSSYEKAMKVLEKAQKEYEITPAGIHELEHELKQNPNSEHCKLQLEEAVALRQARLDAAKQANKIERNHSQKTSPFIYERTALSQDGDELTPLSDNDEVITTMLNESKIWSRRLTTEEIAAVKRYTQGDYADVNGSLSNPDYITEYASAEATQESIRLLDSAIKKSDFNRDVVVYRRHFMFDEKGGMRDIPFEEQQKIFSVGKVYEPGFFMSTSLDPSNAPPSEGGITVFFEIKAKRAASVSVVANSGTNEREFILPKDGKYKIIANTNKVTIDKKGDPRTLTVIQLEEID